MRSKQTPSPLLLSPVLHSWCLARTQRQMTFTAVLVSCVWPTQHGHHTMVARPELLEEEQSPRQQFSLPCQESSWRCRALKVSLSFMPCWRSFLFHLLFPRFRRYTSSQIPASLETPEPSPPMTQVKRNSPKKSSPKKSWIIRKIFKVFQQIKLTPLTLWHNVQGLTEIVTSPACKESPWSMSMKAWVKVPCLHLDGLLKACSRKSDTQTTCFEPPQGIALP